jgi:hypothetical protein
VETIEPKADVALASRPAAANDTDKIRFAFFPVLSFAGGLFLSFSIKASINKSNQTYDGQ